MSLIDTANKSSGPKKTMMVNIIIAAVAGIIAGVVGGMLLKKSNKYKNTSNAKLAGSGFGIGVLFAIIAYVIAMYANP